MMDIKKTYLAILASLSLGTEPALALKSYELSLNQINGKNGFKIRGLGSSTDRISVGSSVKTAGDINGDQIDDLMIGTLTHASYFLFGKQGGIKHPFNLSTLDGSNGFVTLSQGGIEAYSTINDLGDLNNDGINDFSVLNEFNDYKVVFSKTKYAADPILLNLINHPEAMSIYRSSENGLGGMKKLGDINGDGIEDFSVSDSAYGGLTYKCDPYYPSGTHSAKGASYLIFGSDGQTPPTIDLDQLDQALPANVVRIIGKGNLGGIGEGVFQASALGDINGDGLDDLAVTSSGNCVCNCYYRSGSDSYIVFGQKALENFPSSTELTQEQGFRLTTRAPRPSGAYRIYPQKVGDINHDGINDIGYCFVYNNTVDVHQCGVIFGDSEIGPGDYNPPNGTNGFEIHLEERLENLVFHNPSHTLGDFNGDGIDDVLLHRSGNYCGFDCQPTSSALVFWGSDQPFQSIYRYHELDASQHFRISPATNLIKNVSAAGDINHDGLSDLTIG